MARSSLEWISIAAFLLFHLLFLFVDSNTSTFLAISSLFFVFLTAQYIFFSKSPIYRIAFGLNAGSAISIFMRIEDLPDAQAVMIAGFAGYTFTGLTLTLAALRNRQRINTPAILPYAITGLIIVQVLLYYLPGMAEYSGYLNYPIFLFSG